MSGDVVLTHSGVLVGAPQARIIDTILTSNVYRLRPNVDLDVHSPLAQECEREFGQTTTLWQVLSLFGSGRKLHDVLYGTPSATHPGVHVEYVNMLIWLLQRFVLEQVYEYVYLARPLDALGTMDPGEPEPEEREEDGLKRRLELLRRIAELLSNQASCQDSQCDSEPRRMRMIELVWLGNVKKEEVLEALNAFPGYLALCWNT